MGIFDDFMGGLFDFNKDGKTSWSEKMIGFQIMEEMEKESEENDSYDPFFSDDDDFDPLSDDDGE